MHYIDNSSSSAMFARLVGAIKDGIAAGMTCGLGLLVLQPLLRELFVGQSDKLLSISLYLFVCAEIGSVIALFVALAFTVCENLSTNATS